MKVDALRELPQPELETKIRELREELFNFRFRHVTRQLDNPMMLRITKRNLARAMTVWRERELHLDRGRRPEAPSVTVDPGA
ncbi:MAG: 50S ribosomal protein L29 [Candidatus Eisenbacteria bacterium]|jgi:large subunit ribosomal protein L29|nr:50S ribosomal protein L29 [Candidatus Eisenbacteria bacterium]